MKKLISISVIPRASKNEIMGPIEDGTYKIKISTSPVDGAANKKLIEMISEYFNISKSCVEIVKGSRGKKKIIEIDL